MLPLASVLRRSDWAREDCQPAAWHRCGLCFFYEYEQVAEICSSWIVYDNVSLSRLYELRDEHGEEGFNRLCAVLGRQAKVLWLELGNSDFELRQ